jgi:predicted SAM-dependent methyltransferase
MPNKDLEKAADKVYRHYEAMLRVAVPQAQWLIYEEYMANILDGIETPEQLAHIVKSMVSLHGLQDEIDDLAPQD